MPEHACVPACLSACLQAACDLKGNVSNMRALMEHPAFDISNPPACEHLFFGFADSVPNFHAEDGSGYAFMADAIIKVRSLSSGRCYAGTVRAWVDERIPLPVTPASMHRTGTRLAGGEVG
jgi:hypothetical protein